MCPIALHATALVHRDALRLAVDRHHHDGLQHLQRALQQQRAALARCAAQRLDAEVRGWDTTWKKAPAMREAEKLGMAQRDLELALVEKEELDAVGGEAASDAPGSGGKNYLDESMTLNLKTDEGKDVLRRLVAEHDILVENFRPGEEKIGLERAQIVR